MAPSVGFIKTKNVHLSTVNFSTEVKHLNKTKLLDNKTAFVSNNLRAIFREKLLVAGEKLLFHGDPKSGTVRYMQGGLMHNHNGERKKILDALLTIKAQHIFLEGCYKKVDSGNLFLSHKHHKNLKKCQSDRIGTLFRDMLMVMDVFGATAQGGEYTSGQKLNTCQAEMLNVMDPVFIYFYLTPGVKLQVTEKENNASPCPYVIQALEKFFNTHKGEEVVLIYNPISHLEEYFGSAQLPQKLYTLDCSQGLFYDKPPAPIFNKKYNTPTHKGELVFCGDPSFGTISYIKQPKILLDSYSEGLEVSIEAKKKIFDALIFMRAKHIFLEGFFGNIKKYGENKEESKLIKIVQQIFKDYDPNKELSKDQATILNSQEVSILYYYVAPLLLQQEVQLHASTTREQAKQEEELVSIFSIPLKNSTVLDKESTRNLLMQREKCAALKIGLFFREHRGEHIALLFSEGSTLRLWCDTELFGKFIPRYFELTAAQHLELA